MSNDAPPPETPFLRACNRLAQLVDSDDPWVALSAACAIYDRVVAAQSNVRNFRLGDDDVASLIFAKLASLEELLGTDTKRKLN
jgi:hypothetical protein